MPMIIEAPDRKARHSHVMINLLCDKVIIGGISLAHNVPRDKKTTVLPKEGLSLETVPSNYISRPIQDRRLNSDAGAL